MVTFLPPRCEDCGREPGEDHQAWCPEDGPVVPISRPEPSPPPRRPPQPQSDDPRNRLGRPRSDRP